MENDAIINVLISWAAAPIAIVALLSLVGSSMLFRTREVPAGAYGLLIAMASLGTVVGLSTGFSRESVLGVVLPGILTLVSSILAYLLGATGLENWRPVLPAAIIVLVFGALLGMATGSAYRRPFEVYQGDLNQAMLRYEKVVLEYELARHLAELEIWKAERLKLLEGGTHSTDHPGSGGVE